MGSSLDRIVHFCILILVFFLFLIFKHLFFDILNILNSYLRKNSTNKFHCLYLCFVCHKINLLFEFHPFFTKNIAFFFLPPLKRTKAHQKSCATMSILASLILISQRKSDFPQFEFILPTFQKGEQRSLFFSTQF